MPKLVRSDLLERDELSSTGLTIPEMLLRYVWFMGVWSTLVGVMVSVTLARGMGKYKYFSKGAGSYHHRSSRPQWMGFSVLALRGSGAANQRKWARDKDMMHLLHCLFFF